MEPIQVSAIIFFCIFGGAVLGMWLRGVLPQHHLDAETKDLIKLGVALIGTMAAMLLGLLVASAKGAYDARRSELTQMAANTIMVDRVLAHYGPETGEARGLLKATVAGMLDRTWGNNGKDGGPQIRNEILFDKIQELVPQNDSQRAIKSQVESMVFNLGQMNWLLFEQRGSSISTPFLVVVVFWLSTLFVSFGLFAPRNATAFFALFISALSVAGALFLILELDHPFSGLIPISSAPLRNALSVLGR